jgi:hypothetical protein
MVKALVIHTTLGDVVRMKEKAPLAYVRRMAPISIEMDDVSKVHYKSALRYLQHFGVNLAHKGDSIVVERTFQAAKLEIISRNPGIDTTSDAYWKSVGALTMEIVEQSQSNYDIVLKSSLGASTNELTRVFTMFSTDRNQLLNLIYDAEFDITHGKKVRGTKTLTGAMLSLSMLAVISQAFKVWRLKDDKDKTTAQQLLDEFVSNVFQLGYFTGPLYNKLIQGYDVSIMSIDALMLLLGNVTKITNEQTPENFRKLLVSSLDMAGLNLRFLENDLILPGLARIDWTKYDAYARHTAMGLTATDYYPRIESAILANNEADVRQLAEVITKYNIDKQMAVNEYNANRTKDEPKKDDVNYRSYKSTAWYREWKAAGKVDEMYMMDTAIQNAMAKFGAK